MKGVVSFDLMYLIARSIRVADMDRSVWPCTDR